VIDADRIRVKVKYSNRALKVFSFFLEVSRLNLIHNSSFLIIVNMGFQTPWRAVIKFRVEDK
jgi:hypothetical protein